MNAQENKQLVMEWNSSNTADVKTCVAMDNESIF